MNAAARFFLRIGQAGNAAPKRDEYTGELFGLCDYLECEGLLRRNAAPRAPVSASPGAQGEGAVSHSEGLRGEPLSPSTAIATPAAAAYLAKCRAAIECVDINLA